MLALFALAGAAQALTLKRSRGPFVFACQGSPPTKLTATYLGKEADHARLTYKAETVIAKRALSADGARYQAPGIDFWNKGDDATVEWRGKSLNCSIEK
jgi:membrane-bound inhibitor of C-type lysozyme